MMASKNQYLYGGMDQETIHALRCFLVNAEIEMTTVPIQQTSTTAYLLWNSDHTIPSNFHCQQATEVELWKYINCDLSLQIPWTWQREGKRPEGLEKGNVEGMREMKAGKPQTPTCAGIQIKRKTEKKHGEKSYPLAHWIIKFERYILA